MGNESWIREGRRGSEISLHPPRAVVHVKISGAPELTISRGLRDSRQEWKRVANPVIVIPPLVVFRVEAKSASIIPIGNTGKWSDYRESEIGA